MEGLHEQGERAEADQAREGLPRGDAEDEAARLVQDLDALAQALDGASVVPRRPELAEPMPRITA